MTVTINLEPDTETVIERRAKRRGMTIAKYIEQMANSSAQKQKLASERALPKTPAQTIEYWRASGLMDLFKDGPDSPELARELRNNAEARNTV